MHRIRRPLLLLATLVALQAAQAQSGKAFLKEADKLMAQQRFEQAVERYGFAIRTDAGLVKAYTGRAEAWGALGRAAERASDLGRAALLAPAEPAHAAAASTAYFDIDSLAAARRFAVQAVGANPKHQGAQLALARACLKAGDLDCASAAADRAHAIKATTDTYYTRGIIRFAARDYTTAEADLERVLQWNHLYEPAYVALSEVQLAMHDMYSGPTLKLRILEKAIENCTRALELNPRSTDALFTRSKAYAHQKEYAKAIDDASRCIALGRGDGAVLQQRAGYYKGFGQFQNAINDLNQVLLADPKDAMALLLRAECREANLDLEGAQKDLDAALRALQAEGALTTGLRAGIEEGKARIAQRIFEMNREEDPPAITVVRPFRQGDAAKVGSTAAFVEVSGHVRDKSMLKSITVNGVSAEFSKDERNPEFAIGLHLAPDDQEIIVQAIDVYGNLTTEALRVERSEGTAPVIVIDSPKPGGARQIAIAPGRTDLFLEGRVIDNSLIRQITVNGMSASYAPDKAHPDFSIKVELDGRDSFTIRAEDQYGNATEETWTVLRAGEPAAVARPAPAEPGAASAAKGSSWLIHIENTNYRNYPAARATDVAKMQKAFANHQVQRTITKKNLSKEQLERFFNVELRDMVRANKVATLLVWYSGHGRTLGGKAYWIPVDGRKDDQYSFYNYGALKSQMQNYSASVTNTVVVTDAAADEATFFDLTR